MYTTVCRNNRPNLHRHEDGVEGGYVGTSRVKWFRQANKEFSWMLEDVEGKVGA